MPSVNRFLYFFCYGATGRIGLPARHRIRILGDAPNIKGPLIVAAKHSSYWDVPLLARLVIHRSGQIPHFEMGSFHGYPVLGFLRGLMKRLGGFEVMRTKDILRLRAGKDADRSALKATMKRVNDEAAATRAEILREGKILCFFPEGTRDPARLRPVRARQELEDAVRQCREESIDADLLPVMVRYAPKPRHSFPFIARRMIEVDFRPAIALRSASVESLFDDLERTWAESPLAAGMVDGAPAAN